MFDAGIKNRHISTRRTSSPSLPLVPASSIGRRCVLLFLLLIMIFISGCESVKLDGFSVGVIYLNTDLTTNSSLTGQQSTKADGIMPVGLLNFKFK